MKNYLSDITDSQWILLVGVLRDNHKRKYSLRDIFNTIFYLLKIGCQWRMLLGCFPKWELGYYYFTRWKNFGIIEQIHKLLRDRIRKKAGRNESLSLNNIDNHTIKITRLGGENLGIDGDKMIKGRKRHIITDTMGLLLAVVIHAVIVHDSKGATDVIALLKGRFGRLDKIVVNGGYRGELFEKTKTAFGWIIGIVLQSDHSFKFVVITQRWVCWKNVCFGSYQILSEDFEYLIDTCEAIIQFAMIKLMLNRIKNKI